MLRNKERQRESDREKDRIADREIVRQKERERERDTQAHTHIVNLEVGQVHKDGRVSLQLVLHHLEGSLEETAPSQKVKLLLKKI